MEKILWLMREGSNYKNEVTNKHKQIGNEIRPPRTLLEKEKERKDLRKDKEEQLNM